MNDKIHNVHLKFSCRQNLNSMKPVEGGKFCSRCEKKVYDFTDAKVGEFRKILAERSDICGIFTQDQIAFVGIKVPVWKKWISTVLLVIGVNLFNDAQAEAQAKQAFSIGQDTSTIGKNKIFGSVENPPEFPGGINKFKDFIKTNIRYIGDKAGKVIVQFIVETNGLVTDVQIVKGLSPEADEEF